MSASTVWKFALPFYGGRVQMPRDAKVLHVAAQEDLPCLWAEVDAGADPVHRLFVPVGTGQHLPVSEPLYIGTTLLDDGRLVLHWYELNHEVTW